MIDIAKTRRTAGSSPAVCLSAASKKLLQALALSCLLGGQAFAADLVIGVAGPMSGPLAQAGQQYKAAVSYAAAQINKSGGLNGGKLKVISADDKATPKRALVAARKLAAAKASIIIGHYNSTPALAAQEIYLKNNILMVAPQAIISKLTDLKAWNIIRLGPRADAQALAAANYLAGLSKSPKIAIVHDNSPFAKLLADKAAATLTRKNIKAALTGEIPPGSRHTRSIIRRLADRIATAGIDAIYWTGSSSDAAQFLIALRSTKSRALLLGTDVLASAGFAETKQPQALDGARMTHLEPLTGGKEVGELLKKLKLAKAGIAAAPAVAAYAAMQIVVAAAKQVKSNDARRIAAYLRSGKPVETIIGPLTFDEKGDRRETLYQIYRWKRAEDGKLIYEREPAG